MKIKLSFLTILIMSFIGIGTMGFSSANTAVAIPIRPTPMPSPLPPISGGWIVLQANTSQDTTHMWTRVEWQDINTQQWHEVEGWQGHFDESRQVKWFVDPKNFDETPFRWRVYIDQTQTQLLATSEEFALPSDRWQERKVEVDW